MDSEPQILEGVGNEVLVGLSAIVAVCVPVTLFLWWFWRERRLVAIHPESQRQVENTRQRLPEERRGSAATLGHDTLHNGNMLHFQRNTGDNQCPICLIEARFACETNCGHLFCGQCIVTYWHHGNWLGPVNCPVCRQLVTVLLPYFTETEQNIADPSEAAERNEIVREINSYNRRFSGEPRPIMDYICDLPTLLRHLWNEFFSVGGLMYMFRIRVVLCFCAACMYLISPLDAIPEALFGILGLCDDLFVLLLLAIYISIIYRRFLATREQLQ